MATFRYNQRNSAADHTPDKPLTANTTDTCGMCEAMAGLSSKVAEKYARKNAQES